MKEDCDAVPALHLIIINLTWFSCACSSSNSLFIFCPLRSLHIKRIFHVKHNASRAVGPVVGITRYCSDGSHVNSNRSSFVSRAFIKMIIYYLYAQRHKISFTSFFSSFALFFDCILRRAFFSLRIF